METKKAWKLKDFMAHSADVKCLGLGHKSGRVMVTGGEDRKVNLWSVGKPQCIMSLIGHTTSIESVRFSPSEELVVAGSLSGALKVWDLEGAKSLRTLTGHKAGIRAVDFHPYGNFITSGSMDCNVKLWDVRRKGCIFTYKSHTGGVNCVRFTPDGLWIASASEDNTIKIWDLTAGKLLSELKDHTGPVNIVEFHPSDLLLASGSTDRTVKFWDLETFKCISSSDTDRNPVKSICFHPEGSSLYSATGFSLKVYGWEPFVCHEVVPMAWTDIWDMAIANSQLIASSFNKTNVSTYVVDLKQVAPTGTDSKSDPQQLNSSRRSFIRDRPPTSSSAQTSDPKRSDTPPDKNDSTEDEIAVNRAEIQNQDEFKRIFGRNANVKNKVEPLIPPPDDDFKSPVSESKPYPVSRMDPSPRQAAAPREPPYRDSPKGAQKDGIQAEDFLAANAAKDMLGRAGGSEVMSEKNLVNLLGAGHPTMNTVLQHRSRNLQVVRAMWASGNTKSAVDSAISIKDKSVLVDLLNIINKRESLWNLDMCNLLLPELKDLMSSKYESHVATAANSVKLILRSFGPVIKANMQEPPSAFVDISREERHRKCMACFAALEGIKAFIYASQGSVTPKIASDFREIMILLNSIQ